MCNSACLPTAADVELDTSLSRPALVSFVHRVKLDCRRETRLNIEFANLLQQLYASLRKAARSSGGDRVTSLDAKFTIPSEATLEMTVTALVRSNMNAGSAGQGEEEDGASMRTPYPRGHRDDMDDHDLMELGGSPAEMAEPRSSSSLPWFKRRLPLPRLFRSGKERLAFGR